MDKKIRMKDLSSISPLECIIEHIYWMFIIFIDYKIVMFLPLNGLSFEKSKQIMILCMVGASVVGTAIRWRKFMTTRGVLADIMVGLGIYTIFVYKTYYSEWIKILYITFLIISAIYMIFMVFRKSRGKFLFEIRNKYRRRVIIKIRMNRFLSTSGLIVGVLMTVLMVPIAYNRLIHGGIVVADVMHSDTKGFDANYTANEWSLKYNFDSISKIRFKSEWDLLSTKEKLNVLQDICNCETNYWGMDFRVTIVMDDLEGYTLGSYCDSDRRITIDKQHLENDNPEEILDTVLHEMYHAWECSLVRLYLDASDSQKKMRVFQHCEEYIEEMMNYQDGGADYESHMSYFGQYMERDSRAYAAAAVKDYYDEIDLILAEQNKHNKRVPDDEDD
ncbi:MAG: hypothetical protein E7286_07545 [Lachnospiraceae bacterium]|nr:hypothetical protein [Lachnospiraceae bacterium]